MLSQKKSYIKDGSGIKNSQSIYRDFKIDVLLTIGTSFNEFGVVSYCRNPTWSSQNQKGDVYFK